MNGEPSGMKISDRLKMVRTMANTMVRSVARCRSLIRISRSSAAWIAFPWSIGVFGWTSVPMAVGISSTPMAKNDSDCRSAALYGAFDALLMFVVKRFSAVSANSPERAQRRGSWSVGITVHH